MLFRMMLSFIHKTMQPVERVSQMRIVRMCRGGISCGPIFRRTWQISQTDHVGPIVCPADTIRDSFSPSHALSLDIILPLLPSRHVGVDVETNLGKPTFKCGVEELTKGVNRVLAGAAVEDIAFVYADECNRG